LGTVTGIFSPFSPVFLPDIWYLVPGAGLEYSPGQAPLIGSYKEHGSERTKEVLEISSDTIHEHGGMYQELRTVSFSASHFHPPPALP
jgi:hypothetical protein